MKFIPQAQWNVKRTDYSVQEVLELHHATIQKSSRRRGFYVDVSALSTELRLKVLTDFPPAGQRVGRGASIMASAVPDSRIVSA